MTDWVDVERTAAPTWADVSHETPTWTDVTRASAPTWSDPATENLIIVDSGFEETLTDNWYTWAWKTYPYATWERHGTHMAHSGSWVVRPVFQKAGANYRGETYVAPKDVAGSANQLIAGDTYRATCYMRAYDANAKVTMAIKVYDAVAGGDPLGTESVAVKDLSGWQSLSTTFTAPQNPIRVYIYATAAINNLVEKPVWVDTVSLTNCSREEGWTETEHAEAPTWSDV